MFMKRYFFNAFPRMAGGGAVSESVVTAVVAMLLFAGAWITSGCIKNDLPYPKLPQYIVKLAAEGETAEAQLDTLKYTAVVTLDETVDIQNVRFTEFEISTGAEADPDLSEGTYDMRKPIVVNVSLYQNYPWMVTAEQTIERFFTVEGQIGETVIDAVGRRVLVRVPDTADLSALRLTSVKLGPAGITTLSPDLQPGPVNLSVPLDVSATCFDRTEVWTVYAEVSKSVVQTTAVDAWSQVVWAYGAGPADVKNGFRYRKTDSEEWIDVPESEVSQPEGQGAFSACIAHLEPLTEYEVMAVSGENQGNAVKVTTQSTPVLPDGSFDQWWLDGKEWCPWNEGGTSFWDTGNTGAATLGESNVQPSDDTPAGISGKSAMLATKFVGLFGIGKLAAGSIYTGSFKKVDGTNGILDFGRPWTTRPTRLRGYMKFVTAPVDYASAEFKDLMGQNDACHLYVALTDWTTPFEIRTNPKTRQLFDPKSPAVIAYGELILDHNTDGWQEFEIKLEYRSTSREPRYIQITSAASRYGDYFTGGTGTTLWVDDYELLYDY